MVVMMPAQPDTPEARLAALGLELPAIAPPRGRFKACTIAGDLLYLSGKGAPFRGDAQPVPKVGKDVGVEQAQAYAREVALHHLAAAKATLGELSRITQVVKVLGLVNAHPHFTEHPEVINGYSELLIAVLAPAGEHARSAIGVDSLPKGFAVEIEAIFQFR